MNFLTGQVLSFDKPYGMTSFQLVAKVRWLLTRAMQGRKIKVGHAGTLDPLATGVMVVCTGRATKQIDQLQAGVKEYVATLALGATTPSFDREHPVDQTFPTEHITEPLVRETLSRFVGEIMQVPPVYSACKVNGARAYDLARSGKGHEVELKAKPLRIDEIELLDCNLPAREITLRVVCSKGTYIRALARDIGQALHSGAHLTALRRTRVGNYTEHDCFTLGSFEQWLAQQTIETDLPNS
ncbi:MAG: tRNA pseudouridine(55) synthase TruB [Alloprevotella sp.]